MQDIDLTLGEIFHKKNKDKSLQDIISGRGSMYINGHIFASNLNDLIDNTDRDNLGILYTGDDFDFENDRYNLANRLGPLSDINTANLHYGGYINEDRTICDRCGCDLHVLNSTYGYTLCNKCYDEFDIEDVL